MSNPAAVTADTLNFAQVTCLVLRGDGIPSDCTATSLGNAGYNGSVNSPSEV